MLSRIEVNVTIKVGLEGDDLRKLVENLGQPDLGMHLTNTLVNHAHLESGQFRGISLDIDAPAVSRG